jgi:spermidine synthase
VGKLYTSRFYKLLKARLTPEGVIAVQSTSPLMARQSFWCIDRTIQSAGFATRPYHLAVPSFGVWGYILASPAPFEMPTRTLPSLRYLTDDALRALFAFPADMAPVPSEVNRLDNQVLVHLYTSEWKRWS